MTESTNREDRWPEWLEPLRPDDVSRARIQARIRVRSERELARRRRRAAWQAAEQLARRMTPVAAAAILLFGWLALRAGAVPEPDARRPVAVEQLLQPAGGEGPPAFLVSASAPGPEHAYEAALPSGSSP